MWGRGGEEKKEKARGVSIQFYVAFNLFSFIYLCYRYFHPKVRGMYMKYLHEGKGGSSFVFFGKTNLSKFLRQESYL